MLFHRTIRRKMVFGLALVLVMLATLAVGALSGLRSYRGVIEDLRFGLHEAPRRSDLVDAVDLLFEPLTKPDERTAPRYQQIEFQRKLEVTVRKLREYRDKLNRLPASPEEWQRQTPRQAALQEIETHLAIAASLAPKLDDPVEGEAALRRMLQEIGHASVQARKAPDHQDGLHGMLQSASTVYRSRLRLIGWTSAVAVVLFVVLLRYVYGAIFSPLTKLHQGALRVAQGDFDYRVQLNTRDEMAELAESFNKMTARFQEIAGDLDGKVRERSRQLVRSERLAGVGFLAAGVAHEINNPLQAIMVAAESLESRSAEFLHAATPADADVVRQYLGMIRGEAFRCKEITGRLLNFARGTETTRSRTELTTIVSEVITLVGHLSKFRDRTIEFRPSGPVHAEVSGSEVKQVALNLVSNALESMESGGTLRIGVEEHTDHVTLTFQDSGCGMTPEVLEHLFEPFFTQRRDGKGTGLGMSISHRIVTDHGGTIDAASDGPGHGSTIRVHLPRRAAVQLREAA